MSYNRQKDDIPIELMQVLVNTLESTKESNATLQSPWYGLQTAPDDWWTDLPVRDCGVVVGADEILRDDILTWAHKMQVSSA